MDEDTLPEWFWKLLVCSVLGLSTLVVGLASCLALGAADPETLGPLVWDISFDPETDDDVHLWSAYFSPSVPVKLGSRGITMNFVRPGMTRAFTRTGVDSAITSEISGTQIGGPPGAMLGLVFDFRSERDYAAVMLNNNGYVTAYRQHGTTREEWIPLQQWPHVLLAPHTNRLRVDISDGRATIRINDELLHHVPANGQGAVGVIAESRAPGQIVRFVRARCWSRQQNPRASGDSG